MIAGKGTMPSRHAIFIGLLHSMLALSLLSAAPLLAQETNGEFLVHLKPGEARNGALILVQGKIMAKDRTVPLSYTNVFIEGTGIGTMASGDGRFWLRGLAPGTYTLKAQYISYEVGEYTFTVEPGDLLQIEYWLEPRAWRLDTFEVQAERALLDIAETGTARRLSAREIENLPVDGLVEMVALQPGVTLEDNEIHVRGGRSDDTSFVVDGIGVKDPLSAGRYGVGFNEDLINEIEVLTGGFSAEYGQAVSGVVNVSTKEGGERFEGKISYKSDDLAPEANYYNTDNVRATFSGPNPIWKGLKALGVPLPGEQYLIVSGSSDLTDTHLPTASLTNELRSPILGEFWSPRADNQWSGLAKLTWKFDPSKKLNFTYSNQQEVSLGYSLPSEGFPRKFQDILNNYNVFTAQNIVGQANWKHVLGEESYYEINVGRQFNRLHSNRNGVDDFTTYIGPTENVIRLQSEEECPPVEEDPLCGPSYTAGAHIGGDTDRWHDHYSDSWTLKADYAFLTGQFSQFKTGIEYTYSEMQLIDLQRELGSPPPGFLARSQDVFRVHPQTAAGYLQDRISYKGLVLNLGARLDAWAPGREVDDVMSRPEDFVFIFDDMKTKYEDDTYSVLGRRWKARISPRVGVSFPVSKRDKFFFNYGHFNQWPRYNYVYAQLETSFATDLQLLGNPNLDPKATVQYETGIQHEFDGLWSAGLTFYSNDIFGYAQAVSLDTIVIDPVDTPDPNDQVAVTAEPVRYFNADAARSIGVEFSIIKRATRWLNGSFSFEFQRTTGTNSSANTNFLTAQLGQASEEFVREQNIRNVPLLWDRPWSATMNLGFSVGPRDRPSFFGWKLPPRWSANVLLRAWSGVRYTEMEFGENGNPQTSANINHRLGPYRSAVDIKFNKYWDLPNRHRVSMFIEARNVFDHDNFRRVNPWTGDGYHLGNWDGGIAADRNNGSPRSVRDVNYQSDFVDPSYRTDPRMFLTGVSYKW